MSENAKTRLGILKLLRADRTKEFGADDIFEKIKEDIPSLQKTTFYHILGDYLPSGIIYRRIVGNTRNNVYETFSLVRRPNQVDSRRVESYAEIISGLQI